MPDRSHHAEHDKYAAARLPPLWERIVAGIGVLMIASLLGYLFYEVTFGDHSPPDIEVRLLEVHGNGNDWLVTFEAVNLGGRTASGVVIQGELSRWGLVAESSEVTLDFIPAKSSRRGGLYFQTDPGNRDIALRAAAYVVP